jgi:hypothetical protein
VIVGRFLQFLEHKNFVGRETATKEFVIASVLTDSVLGDFEALINYKKVMRV